MSAHPLSGRAFILEPPCTPASPASPPLHPPPEAGLAAKCPLQPKAEPGPRHLPPSQKVNDYPLLSLYSPIKVLIFNFIPGEKEERGFRMGGEGSLPVSGLYSSFAKVKEELVPFRKGQG